MSSRKIVCAIAAVALAGLTSTWACGGNPEVAGYDRAALLNEVANDVIVPGYSKVADDAQALHSATGALCAGASEKTLKAARDAWSKLFLDWQRTQAYAFGPAADDHYGSEMAFWPTDSKSIETQVSGTEAIDAHAIDALGSK